MSEKVTLGDVLVATGAGTESATIRTITGGINLAAVGDFGLLRSAVEAAERRNVPVSVGPVYTADLFYRPEDDSFATLQAHGVLGVEMEIAALYMLAAAEGARALGLLTVSDDIVQGKALRAKDREDMFDAMVQIALDVA